MSWKGSKHCYRALGRRIAIVQGHARWQRRLTRRRTPTDDVRPLHTSRIAASFPADNPLTNTHILVSPHRTKRPWLGQTEPPAPSNLPQYDKNCYLCPGNVRANGSINEDYKATMIFENDYAAVLPPPGPAAPAAPHPLLTTEPVQGGCDVVCFHPRHDLSLPTLGLDDILAIIAEWTHIYHRRGTQDGIAYVQIFEAGHSLVLSTDTD